MSTAVVPPKKEMYRNLWKKQNLFTFRKKTLPFNGDLWLRKNNTTASKQEQNGHWISEAFWTKFFDWLNATSIRVPENVFFQALRADVSAARNSNQQHKFNERKCFIFCLFPKAEHMTRMKFAGNAELYRRSYVFDLLPTNSLVGQMTNKLSDKFP